MKLLSCGVIYALASLTSVESQRWVDYGRHGYSNVTPNIPECGEHCAKVLGLTNKFRESMGLPMVCLNSKLMATAKMHNDYQVMKNEMTHIGPNGQTLGDRLLLNGYEYRTARENVAKGMSGAKNAMNGWVNSDGHKKNLLSETNHTGIVYNSNGRFWTQVFGRPMTEGEEVCDMTTKYGKYGTTVSTKNTRKPSGCGSKCRHILKTVNERRARVGAFKLCVSPKLSLAAEDYLMTRTGKSSLSDTMLETAVTDSGYSWKKYGTLKISVSFSYSDGRQVDITDEMLLPSLTKQINSYQSDESVLNKDYTQLGIAGTADKKTWMLIFGDTWDVTNDRCADGSSPIDTGVSSEHGKVNENPNHNPSSRLLASFGFLPGEVKKVYDNVPKATSLAFTYSMDGTTAGLVRPAVAAYIKSKSSNYPVVESVNYSKSPRVPEVKQVQQGRTAEGPSSPSNVYSEDYRQYYSQWWNRQIEARRKQQQVQPQQYFNAYSTNYNNPWQAYPAFYGSQSFRQG